MKIIWAALAAAMLGCGGDAAEAPDTEPAGGSQAGAAPTWTAPPGGLAEWIEEVRAGLDTVQQRWPTDLPLAQQRATMLYVERQEPMEIYYGTAGRMNPPADLANAVMEAERRFHAILGLLSSGDTARLRAELSGAVTALDEQYAAVLTRARSSGLSLTPDSTVAR